MTIHQKIARWWDGEYKHAEYPLIGIRRHRHWTSTWANRMSGWLLTNAWQLAGTLIAAAGVWVAYLAIT
ncbi:hypothetical protein [Terrihabitans sp. B22-R8]|uniref:hypothetical protein n=1 Tax=Terrihabitans sp. B22-R8 TaxID=3425128 RepID=UPI00403D4BB1